MIKLIKNSFYKEEDTKNKLSKFVAKADWLSFGPECMKFEEQFAKYQGRKHCIFVNSGSSANLALIQSLLNTGKLKTGDPIGFSAVTWATNVMPLIELGLNPVPIDVELDTLNVSGKTLNDCLKKTSLKALFLTNLLGFCSDIDRIAATCKKRNILLIEDNCESLGTIYHGKKLGNFGMASTFSFYVGHHMSTIEGGAICTDNDKLAMMLRIVRAHGWDRNLSTMDQDRLRNKNKINTTFYSRYTFYDLGYNFRPTEIQGFLGQNQIKYMPNIIKRRNRNFFKLALPIYKQSDRFFAVKYSHIDFLSNFAIPVICRSTKIRDALVEKCTDKLEVRPVVGGDITEQPFFAKYVQRTSKFKNPNAALIHKQGLYFGNNPDVTEKEISEIVKIFTS